MKVLTIIGPTAIGKTSLAVAAAEKCNGEIISADSRQIYRYMPIGTAQPDADQRKKIQFHLVNFIDPAASYSCGQFARDAETCIGSIIIKQHTPIICGGTGLYIKALFDPLHPLPESDPAIKEKLIQTLNKEGIESLYTHLTKIDPGWAKTISPRDKQRILRGLEVYELTNTPLSELTADSKRKPCYEPLYIGLHLPRHELYKRIDRRLDLMIRQGLIEEVQNLVQRNFNHECNALRTIGYREIIAYLEGNISLATAIAQAKQHTRQFAKRQITWFRKLPNVQWYDPRDKDLSKHVAACAHTICNEC